MSLTTLEETVLKLMRIDKPTVSVEYISEKLNISFSQALDVMDKLIQKRKIPLHIVRGDQIFHSMCECRDPK